MKRLYFVGEPWLIERMKELYGDTIDYIVQQPVPVGKSGLSIWLPEPIPGKPRGVK